MGLQTDVNNCPRTIRKTASRNELIPRQLMLSENEDRDSRQAQTMGANCTIKTLLNFSRKTIKQGLLSM
jgi:hypothetical protein